MIRRSPKQAWPPGRYVPAICVAMHLMADWLLISRAWVLPDAILLISVGLPLSQCSLIALWAATSRANLFLRFVTPPLGAIFCWYVLARQLTWGIGEAATAGWAVLIGVQTLAIVIIINAYRRARPHTISDGVRRSRLALDLSTLVLSTMVVAFLFAAVQYGHSRLKWSATLFDWEYFNAMPVLGLFNAVLAIHWLWALASGSWQRRGLKIIGTIVSLAVLVRVFFSIINRMIAAGSTVTLRELAWITIAQSLFIVSTLWVVLGHVRRSVQTLGERDAAAGSAR